MSRQFSQQRVAICTTNNTYSAYVTWWKFLHHLLFKKCNWVKASKVKLIVANLYFWGQRDNILNIKKSWGHQNYGQSTSS